MYVLYATASYYDVVCMAVKSLNKVSDIPVLVYMLDDYREVPGANTVWWQCGIEDLPKGTYIDRNNSKIYDILIQRPLIVKDALERFAKTVCYVDSDSIATKYVDRIFNYYPKDSKYPYFTEGIYDYLHNNGRGGAESVQDLSTTLEHPACELFGVAISTRSISGLLIMVFQSEVEFSKPNLAAASCAILSLNSATVCFTGIISVGQKNIGTAEYASEWALPMNPPPIRPTLIFFISIPQ
jgi:hypothetical protein